VKDGGDHFKIETVSSKGKRQGNGKPTLYHGTEAKLYVDGRF